MAKNDNLTDFLTDVANAIREKKGTTDLINPQDFSAEIASIETGGGGSTSASANDVNFRDYDGTILHSYSKDEFLALSELPELPTQQGLICQEWNYSLEDAQSYVSDYGKLEVGATYITDDGKTRLYISVPKYRQNVTLNFKQTMANGVTIDWGDGYVETSGSVGNVFLSHAYAIDGYYVISFNVADGCTLGFNNGGSYTNILGSTNYKIYGNMLQRVEIGAGVTSIDNYAFQYCYSLSSVVIPKNVTSLGNNTFQYCYSLNSVIIPKSIIKLGSYAFQYCYSLSTVALSCTLTSLGYSTFYYCHSLPSVAIPQNVITIPYRNFDYCTSLRSVIIPQNVITIDEFAYDQCPSLSYIVMPQSLTSIKDRAFQYCYGMVIYDFRALNVIPILSATTAFNNIVSDCKIVVPDALYNEWITATNWSSLSSYIVKASEFNG